MAQRSKKQRGAKNWTIHSYATPSTVVMCGTHLPVCFKYVYIYVIGMCVRILYSVSSLYLAEALWLSFALALTVCGGMVAGVLCVDVRSVFLLYMYAKFCVSAIDRSALELYVFECGYYAKVVCPRMQSLGGAGNATTVL